MSTERGILSNRIDRTPIAIIDLETTGLTPGIDRVVEAAVVRLEPGRNSYLAFDTMVNPKRPVTATEIHGITDEDVANAPTFSEIAGNFVSAVSGCVIAAYNVYFDIRFLTYELERAGASYLPPHFCLMYMRPLLGIGPRCNLEEACRICNIQNDVAHIAAIDAQASAQLLEYYLQIIMNRNIYTYEDLSKLKSYKFIDSFINKPFADPSKFNLQKSEHLCSRVSQVPVISADTERIAVQEYWDALQTVLADLEITDDELEYILEIRSRIKLPKEKIRMLHAKVYSSVICRFIEDRWLDEEEVSKLQRLFHCLSKLGWAPGE